MDILLSLLSQQSRHIRQVCKTVFSSICPNVTAAALGAILEVSNPRAVARCHMTSHDDTTTPLFRQRNSVLSDARLMFFTRRRLVCLPCFLS